MFYDMRRKDKQEFDNLMQAASPNGTQSNIKIDNKFYKQTWSPYYETEVIDF
mgnify:CR=1 FL=1